MRQFSNNSLRHLLGVTGRYFCGRCISVVGRQPFGRGDKMKILSIVSLAVLVVCLVAPHVFAESTRHAGLRPAQDRTTSGALEPRGMGPAALNEAAARTYCIVKYDFETLNWQGWTRMDNTAQPDSFFHVENFLGIAPGHHGRLLPIEAVKSMWCGARPNSLNPYLCHFRNLPGYGNNWKQVLVTKRFSFVGALTLSYHGVFDTERGHDFVYVEYDAGGGDWKRIHSYDGLVDTVASHVLYLPQVATKFRFFFRSDGQSSDEDGYDSDGACVLDSISIRDDTGVIRTSTFEEMSPGARSDGFWYASTETPFGEYSGLEHNLADKDPCCDDFGTQIVFFLGSPYPSVSYPGLYDTPFCAGPGATAPPCQDEMVVSPVIDMKKYSTGGNENQNADIPVGDLPGLGGATLEFQVYRDLPLRNLVFYMWHVRSIDPVTGCPGPWLDKGSVYYGSRKDYFDSAEDISSLVGDSPIQVALGVVDMCDDWTGLFGDCAEHTPSPWFDSVAVYRYQKAGPNWWCRDTDLFQDNFPNPTILNWVRADCSSDINWADNPTIRPGDSVVVQVTSTLGGGVALAGGKPAVYMHVRCTYIGAPPLKPPISGSDLQGTYGSYIGVDPGGWTMIQGDTARARGRSVENSYAFDLNDSLFTYGYLIEYYFTAQDNAGGQTALPRWARLGGPYFEFTCLPTLASDILFVDNYSGIGSFAGTAEDYWTSTFRAVLPANNQPDRYDVNGPSSLVSNGLASRAPLAILAGAYEKIIWDSGDLDVGTMTDGTMKSDKSNDCALLTDWMRYSGHSCGLWICGDNVASDLSYLGSGQAMTLMRDWCGVNPINKSYFDLTGGRTMGGVVSPLVTGDNDLGLFVHAGVPDAWFVFGGCPVINDFDCLEATACGRYAMDYPAYNGYVWGSAIGAEGMNGNGQAVRTMWFGHSFQYVCDNLPAAPIDRFHIAADVINWMQNIVNPDITEAGNIPKAYNLSQNYPNPFNPTTTIKFDVKEKGSVTLKIYNVAGQLIRTLHDGVMDAGSYTLTWDGKNNRGASVATGVYLYKMEAKNFSKTRKLVLLR
jgi:hypothetical protein